MWDLSQYSVEYTVTLTRTIAASRTVLVYTGKKTLQERNIGFYNSLSTFQSDNSTELRANWIVFLIQVYLVY